MIGVQVIRRPAGDEEIERALTQLDQRACIYFGCDAGVARFALDWHLVLSWFLDPVHESDGPAVSIKIGCYIHLSF